MRNEVVWLGTFCASFSAILNKPKPVPYKKVDGRLPVWGIRKAQTPSSTPAAATATPTAKPTTTPAPNATPTPTGPIHWAIFANRPKITQWIRVRGRQTAIRRKQTKKHPKRRILWSGEFGGILELQTQQWI